MYKISGSIVVILIFIGLGFTQPQSETKELNFSPAEVESMLFLYNQTTVKGSEVEIVAPLGTKLKAGLKEARAQKDTTKSIILKLTPTELQVCLNIIAGSTFEAKYAELVLSMKKKIEKLLPPPMAPTVTPPQK